MTTSERETAAALERAIVQRIGEPRYQLWFQRHTRFRLEDGLLAVGVPNLHFQEWLETTFGEAVRAAAAEVAGRPVPVRFTIDPELFQAARKAQEEAEAPPAAKREPHPAPEAVAPAPLRERRWRRLHEFVVGACNRLAHASALALVESPELCPGLLVIHGPVGTGKTHLLEGVYSGWRQRFPGWRTRFVASEEFTNRFLSGMHHGKLGAFRKQFREADALLVDDLQFLAGKRATQEEFLHTFDALQNAGKPVVITCDCHPRLADDWLPELADRLLAGAVCGLAPPDPATRLDLLRAKSVSGEPAVPEAVLRFLAENLRGNVRELEGALHSVRHFGRVSGKAIDVALAREALADLMRHAVRVVQLADVQRAVCRVLGLEAGALQTKQRSWAVSHPRMLAMYLARKHTAATFGEIGRHFGGRNHSTAVAAQKQVRKWLDRDEELVLGRGRLSVREVVELIEAELQGQRP